MRMSVYILFALIISVFSSCNKETPPSSFAYYFVASINNAPVKFEADVRTFGPFECFPVSYDEGFTPNFTHYEGTTFKESVVVPSEQITIAIVKKFDHASASRTQIDVEIRIYEILCCRFNRQ